MRARSWTLLLVGLFFAASVAAQDPKDFDLDKDGFLDKVEIRSLLLSSVAFGDLDKNKDGTISAGESANFTDLALVDAVENCGEPPYSIETVNRCLGLKPKDISLGGILIRQSYEDLDLATSPLPGKKAKPALFAYSQNRKNDSSQWQVQGAIIRPSRLYTAPAGSQAMLSAVQVVPSITLDRLETTDTKAKDKETNSAIVRLGIDLESNKGLFDLQNYRLYLSYATDFGFDKDVRALEFDWEPQALGAGIGVFKHYKPLPFSYRFRFRAHVEAGKIFDGAGDPDLINGDEFARIGPKIQLEIQPDFFERLTLRVGGNYFYSLSGEPGQAGMVEAAMNVALDSAEHVSLEVIFQNGLLPLTLEETKSLEVGIGIKF